MINGMCLVEKIILKIKLIITIVNFCSFSSLYCAFHLTKVSISKYVIAWPIRYIGLTIAVHSAHGPRKQRLEPWLGLVAEVKVDIKTPL